MNFRKKAYLVSGVLLLSVPTALVAAHDWVIDSSNAILSSFNEVPRAQEMTTALESSSSTTETSQESKEMFTEEAAKEPAVSSKGSVNITPIKKVTVELVEESTSEKTSDLDRVSEKEKVDESSRVLEPKTNASSNVLLNAVKAEEFQSSTTKTSSTTTVEPVKTTELATTHQEVVTTSQELTTTSQVVEPTTTSVVVNELTTTQEPVQVQAQEPKTTTAAMTTTSQESTTTTQAPVESTTTTQLLVEATTTTQAVEPTTTTQAPVMNSANGMDQPSTAAYRDYIINTYGLTVGSYRPGDPGDHGKGLAIDVMVPVSSELGDQIAQEAINNMGSANISYVIWKQRIYGPWTNGQWQPMEDRGSITQNHFDHVHISFNN
ncbi:hypothetical protein [Facklamia hominis]|uniref:hypothetical protein n=1 Tax=Facklamia hominis TaxID=178214 RepID=UPI00288B5664|nr:hypothetical protein [Facklamia hominis]WPJ90915.1 hypothetical protein R0V13_00490 [Facklamia hominis]